MIYLIKLAEREKTGPDSEWFFHESQTNRGPLITYSNVWSDTELHLSSNRSFRPGEMSWHVYVIGQGGIYRPRRRWLSYVPTLSKPRYTIAQCNPLYYGIQHVADKGVMKV